MSKVYIANWKANLSLSDSESLARRYLETGLDKLGVEIFVAPSHFALEKVEEVFKNSSLKILAQDVSEFEKPGAFTGEVFAEFLKEIGVSGSLVGHSERRVYLNESESLKKKVLNLVRNNLLAILCIGENSSERASGMTKKVIETQLENDLSLVSELSEKNLMIAYEPVWAISTFPGAKPATYFDIEPALIQIREWLKKRFGETLGGKIKVLYGGSVKPENIKEYKINLIDGFLVGGAGLDPEKFKMIITA